MGFLPKIPDLGQIEKVFDDDFDRLIATLDGVTDRLDTLIAEIQGLRSDLGGSGSPPASRSM